MNTKVAVASVAIALSLTIAAFCATAVTANAAKLPKVTICHVGFDEATNTTTFDTITVSGNAVDKHIQNHNDTLGECPEDEEV